MRLTPKERSRFEQYLGHLQLRQREMEAGIFQPDADDSTELSEETPDTLGDDSDTVSLSELRDLIPSAHEGKRSSVDRVRDFVDHESWPDPISEKGTRGTATYRAKYSRAEVMEAISEIVAYEERGKNPYESQ